SRRPCTTRATWSPMTAARSRRSAIPGSRRRTPTGPASGRDGNSITVRGTFNETQEYRRLDVVARNGGSFVALKDVPGPCPGAGWQLWGSRGKRGVAGARGERGERGPKGDPGLSGATICDWKIDRARYVATPVMSDGREGPPLELRGLFEQFI